MIHMAASYRALVAGGTGGQILGVAGVCGQRTVADGPFVETYPDRLVVVRVEVRKKMIGRQLWSLSTRALSQRVQLAVVGDSTYHSGHELGRCTRGRRRGARALRSAREPPHTWAALEQGCANTVAVHTSSSLGGCERVVLGGTSAILNNGAARTARGGSCRPCGAA